MELVSANSRGIVIKSKYKLEVYDNSLIEDGEIIFQVGDVKPLVIRNIRGLEYTMRYVINSIEKSNKDIVTINEFELTDSSVFLTPLLNLKIFKLKGVFKEVFVNTYLSLEDENYSIQMVLRYLPYTSYQDLLNYLQSNDNFKYKYSDGALDILIFSLNSNKRHFNLFLQSKFHNFSKLDKIKITQFNTFLELPDISYAIAPTRNQKLDLAKDIGVNVNMLRGMSLKSKIKLQNEIFQR